MHGKIRKKVIEIVSDQLCVDVSTITCDSNLEKLGLDSLDKTELAMSIEDNFWITVVDEEFESCVKTISDAVDYIVVKKVQLKKEGE